MTVAEPSHTATVGELTDDGIERFREKLGVDWPYTRWTTWNEDGDPRRHPPLRLRLRRRQPAVRAIPPTRRRRGGVGSSLRPDSWKAPASRPALPDAPELKGRGKGALSGVHMFWAGDHTRYFNAVREGDRIWVRRFYVDITAKEQSRFGGRSAVSVRRRVYWNQRGELVAIWDADFVHTERRHRRRRATPSRPRASNTCTPSDELQVVDDHYAAETHPRRGASIRRRRRSRRANSATATAARSSSAT